MLRAVQKLPGVQAFSSSLTSATDSQDVAVAQSKVSARVFSVAGLLGRQMQPLQHLPDSINISSASQRAALQRLQQRAQHAGVHAFGIIVNGDLQQWESMICASLAAGMSLQLLPSTVQDQLVQKLRLPLWLGRTLALSSEEQATCKRHIEYKDADGRIQQLQVDLAFPANSRTITRLMEAWWGCKGGRHPGSSKRAAAALAGTSKPRFKAMPVSFNNAVEKVMYLEAELLSALKEINAQQLALKERGNPMWFHPSRLTSGGQFATTSAAFRARQAAQALLATAQHLYMPGSRQAETARGTWDHSSVPGLSAEPPVWALGLSGLLKQFQATLGTGFAAVYYHCKGYMDFGTPEYHDILPAACSGLCLASITALTFAVLMYLQPVSPAEPIIKQQRGAGSPSSSSCAGAASSSGGESSSRRRSSGNSSSSSSSSGGEGYIIGTQHTLNNAMGFTLPYGGLQHVASFDEVTPSMVNSALAGAKFLGNSFDKSKGTSAPPADLMQQHNRPSLYGFRSMHAGEVFLIMRQLLKANQPAHDGAWGQGTRTVLVPSSSSYYQLSHSSNAIGPAPHRSGRRREHCSIMFAIIAHTPSLFKKGSNVPRQNPALTRTTPNIIRHKTQHLHSIIRHR